MSTTALQHLNADAVREIIKLAQAAKDERRALRPSKERGRNYGDLNVMSLVEMEDEVLERRAQGTPADDELHAVKALAALPDCQLKINCIAAMLKCDAHNEKAAAVLKVAYPKVPKLTGNGSRARLKVVKNGSEGDGK